MAEIPEHLLRRSRERRAQAGGASEGAAPAAGEGAATPAKAEAAAPAAPAAPLPRVSEPPAAEAPTTPVDHLPPGRSRMPVWMMPVFLAVPVFAFFYAQAFQNPPPERPTDPLELGALVYRSSGCSGCHGANGQGGVGPALAGDESELTFPDEQDQINWVRTGSAPLIGQVYGDPDRPGGPRVAQGGMPGFAGTLSDEEIAAVVKYERERL